MSVAQRFVSETLKNSKVRHERNRILARHVTDTERRFHLKQKPATRDDRKNRRNLREEGKRYERGRLKGVYTYVREILC